MVAALLFTMSFNKFQPKTPDLEDDRGKWNKTKDGRLKMNVKEDQFGTNTEFKNAVIDACNNNFPNGGSQDAFQVQGKTYSLNEFNGTVMVYEGEAKYPNKSVIQFPKNYVANKQNFGGGGKKPYTPPKIIVQGAIKNPQWLPVKDALEKCNQNPNLFLFPSTQNFDDELGTTCVYIGDAPIVE